MPVMDEFKEEREAIKNASPEKKWKYFKDYYLKWVIGGAIGLGLLISFIVSVVTQKEGVLEVIFINFNAMPTAEAQVEEAFTQQYVENPKKQRILLDTGSFISVGEVSSDNASPLVAYGYEDETKLMALAYSGSIDLMISGQDVIEKYMEAEWFVSLDTVLDAQTLAKYEEEGRVLYFNEMPAAVCVDSARLLNENYAYAGGEGQSLYAAFGGGSKHAEMAAEFLKFIE